LDSRFGSSTAWVQEKVRSINDLQLLDKTLANIFAAKLLAEVQGIVEKVLDEQGK
jgi:hypothetical protein